MNNNTIFYLLRNIFPIHPNFRLIGIGETQKSSSSGQRGFSQSLASWISPELLSIFHFHHVKSLPVSQEKEIIQRKVINLSENITTCLILSSVFFKFLSST